MIDARDCRESLLRCLSAFDRRRVPCVHLTSPHQGGEEVIGEVGTAMAYSIRMMKAGLHQ